MINIESVKARALRVPMAHPHRTASGTVAESPLVLIDAVTSAGVSGHGIVFTYTVAALRPVADLINHFAELVKGDDLAPTVVEEKLSRKFRLLGTQGLVGMAIAGIDMALWDAQARTRNLSLARLLGAAPRPIPAYGAIGYDGVSAAAQVAGDWAKRGFKGVKAKIGYPTIKEDLETIRAIRSTVGPEVAIMVDYNQSLTPAEAIARLRHLDDEGLTWIEEPALAHDFTGHAHIAREIRTPIQAGENWWGILDMRHAIDAHATDYMMPDVMKIGGVTGWMRAAALAEAHGIKLSNHLWPEISAQLMCATPTAHWLEYADWWNPVLKNPLRIENGMALIDDSPGNGIEWNEAAVARMIV